MYSFHRCQRVKFWRVYCFARYRSELSGQHQSRYLNLVLHLVFLEPQRSGLYFGSRILFFRPKVKGKFPCSQYSDKPWIKQETVPAQSFLKNKQTDNPSRLVSNQVAKCHKRPIELQLLIAGCELACLNSLKDLYAIQDFGEKLKNFPLLLIYIVAQLFELKLHHSLFLS